MLCRVVVKMTQKGAECSASRGHHGYRGPLTASLCPGPEMHAAAWVAAQSAEVWGRLDVLGSPFLAVLGAHRKPAHLDCPRIRAQ